MNRKPLFWLGTLALSLVVGTLPANGQTRTTKTATRSKAQAKPAAPAPAYSAARTQSRRTKLAVARASAMMREMAADTLPRYKVDASG